MEITFKVLKLLLNITETKLALFVALASVLASILAIVVVWSIA